MAFPLVGSNLLSPAGIASENGFPHHPIRLEGRQQRNPYVVLAFFFSLFSGMTLSLQNWGLWDLQSPKKLL